MTLQQKLSWLLLGAFYNDVVFFHMELIIYRYKVQIRTSIVFRSCTL